MRSVKFTSKFKRDLKREYKTYGKQQIDEQLDFVLSLLCLDIALPAKFKDHPLKGNYLGARDCHLRFDLVFVYRLIDNDTLRAERLGSHSEIL